MLTVTASMHKALQVASFLTAGVKARSNKRGRERVTVAETTNGALTISTEDEGQICMSMSGELQIAGSWPTCHPPHHKQGLQQVFHRLGRDFQQGLQQVFHRLGGTRSTISPARRWCWASHRSLSGRASWTPTSGTVSSRQSMASSGGCQRA